MSDSKAGKIGEITSAITSAVEVLCKCTNFDVFADMSSLTCDRGGDKTAVIYYGTISNEMLLQNITTWVKNTDEIIVSDTVLKINTDCPVKVDKRDNTKCESATTNKQTGSNSTAIAVPVAVILVILVMAVVTLVAGFIYWKRRHRKSHNMFLRYVYI